jgi:hypothetical protein
MSETSCSVTWYAPVLSPSVGTVVGDGGETELNVSVTLLKEPVVEAVARAAVRVLKGCMTVVRSA